MTNRPHDQLFAGAILEIELQRRREAEKESDLASVLLSALRGSVWHTTNYERYTGILSAGAILPEPPIPDSDRWGTGPGTIGCPYVRSIGGVSLFDFRDFDPEEYSKDYPVSGWREFVPCRSKWGEAIWIEVDLSKLMAGFLSGREILDRWKAAAHVGALPMTAFRRVLRISKDSGAVSQLEEDFAESDAIGRK